MLALATLVVTGTVILSSQGRPFDGGAATIRAEAAILADPADRLAASTVSAAEPRRTGLRPLSIRATRPTTSTRPPATVDTTPSTTPTSAATATTDTAPADGAEQPTTTGQPSAVDGSSADADTNANATTTEETTSGAGNDRPDPDDACFQPRFRDEFNGDTLGPEWHVYTTPGAHSTHAMRVADAVRVADGMLQITATNNAEAMLVSGGLRRLDQQTYGRFRARVRTDPDLTNATSGVILTWPSSNDQPTDGENNFYETLRAPGGRSPFYSFIHEPFDDKADGVSQTRFIHRGDATRWQEVTMDWTPHHVTVTAAGVTHRLEETPEDLITDAEHFLAIQLDLFKGSFPDDRRVTMQVDWVEVWSYCGG